MGALRLVLRICTFTGDEPWCSMADVLGTVSGVVPKEIFKEKLLNKHYRTLWMEGRGIQTVIILSYIITALILIASFFKRLFSVNILK